MLTFDFRTRLPGTCALPRDIDDIYGVRAITASAAAPFISPFRTPIIPPSGTPVISPPRIPISNAHFAPRPIAIIVKPRTHGKAEPKAYYRLDIGRIWLHVDDLGIVLRNIDHLGLGRHDADVAFLLDDALLRGIDQRARRSCLCAERLDRIHDVGRLIQKDLSELSRPLQILIHPLDNLGVAGQGPDAFVPWLVVDLSWVAACGKKACRQDDIGRDCGCRQNHCDESVRIQSDWTKQLVEFFLR